MGAKSAIIATAVVMISLTCCSIEPVELPIETIERGNNDGFYQIKPSNMYEKEAIERAIRYSSLQWTPKADIPMQGGDVFFEGGEIRQGMLYAEAASQDKRVGYDVSLYTFLTAINNPYSLLYTENVSKQHSKSAYGNIYYGDGNSGAYMGVACNSYVYYVLGSIIPYSSFETAGLAEERGIVSRVQEQSALSLRLLDILQTPGHIKIITNLWLDDYNRIRMIEISEAIGSGVRSYKLPAEDFDAWISSSGYTLYRFNTAHSVGDVSPLSDVDGDIIASESIVYNNDICTFAGDRASFLEDDIIVLNYSKGEYKAIEIYCDNTMIDCFLLEENEYSHSIDISNKHYGAGLFKARLIGDGVYSGFTHWEVINAVIKEDLDFTYFSCNNAKPLYWGWFNIEGWASWKQTLSEEEIEAGIVKITNRDTSYPIFKIYFQGRYGRVAVKHYSKLIDNE